MPAHLSAEYLDYLSSPEWRDRREQALWRAHNRCQLCDSPEHLDVHHRTYKRFKNERVEESIKPGEKGYATIRLMWQIAIRRWRVVAEGE